MRSDIKKVLVVTLMAIGTLFLSQQAQARTWYNFPDYSKIKVDKGADGQYWFYMEFKWDESCPPNFQKDQAIEFEIGIIPKCFLRPRGEKDDNFDCIGVMGFDKFALPNEILPDIGERNCYVDLWNYWNPTASQVKAELYQDCDFDTSGDWCAEVATNSGAFLDPIGNFAVGLHDASALQAGVLYSFRYPLELVTLPEPGEVVDASVAQHAWQCNAVGQYPSAKQCYGDSTIMEDKFRGYYEHSPLFTYTPEQMFPDWGRAQVTMQVFKNKCDLPWVCDKVYKEYTCPHLIGAVNSVAGCIDAQKTTDYWLTNLCLPTGDFEFTPGVAKASGAESQCMTEATSIDLNTYNSCCIDLDGDGYYGYSQKELYGTQAGDCNDYNPNINPGAFDSCWNNIDEDCDGYAETACIAGGGSGDCPQSSECNTGDHFLSTCPNGVDYEEKVCENCEWVAISTCPPETSCQPGDQMPCGNCGFMNCESNGEWGSCFNQGACSPGQTQQQNCNSIGTQTKTCISNCTWSGWSSCSAECEPGHYESQSCSVGGQSGTQVRFCNLNGTWGSWEQCISSCVCSSGTCCDGCNYYSSSYACDGYYIYQCQGGNPGQDAQKAVVSTYCSGNSSSCNGQTSQGNWLLHENCSSSQQCEMNGNYAECVAINTCQDVYLQSSGGGPCHTQGGTQYGYTACLELDQIGGPLWRYRICRDSGSFPYGIKYQLFDENHTTEDLGGQYQEGGGQSCTNWHTFNIDYVTLYGENNGAGLHGEIISPPACTLNSCKYQTGIITVRKECQ